MIRHEIEAHSVTPFKHALVQGESVWPIVEVERRGEWVVLHADEVIFFKHPTESVTVDLIGDDPHKPDPGQPPPGWVESLAARPKGSSWRSRKLLSRLRSNSVSTR